MNKFVPQIGRPCTKNWEVQQTWQKKGKINKRENLLKCLNGKTRKFLSFCVNKFLVMKKKIGLGVSRNYGMGQNGKIWRNLKSTEKRFFLELICLLIGKSFKVKSSLSNLWTIPSEENLILFFFMTSYCLEIFLDRIQNYFLKILFFVFYISSNLFIYFLKLLESNLWLSEWKNFIFFKDLSDFTLI